MKKFKLLRMKEVITLIVIIMLCSTGYSQGKHIFIRVFDHKGQKFEKGFFAGTTDSTLILWSGNYKTEIPIKKIDVLKLKRSFGHTVVMSSLVVGISFGLILALSANPTAEMFAFTAGQGFIGGLVTGGAIGAAFGSLTASLGKKPVLFINGNQERWLKVREMLEANYTRE